MSLGRQTKSKDEAGVGRGGGAAGLRGCGTFTGLVPRGTRNVITERQVQASNHKLGFYALYCNSLYSRFVPKILPKIATISDEPRSRVIQSLRGYSTKPWANHTGYVKHAEVRRSKRLCMWAFLHFAQRQADGDNCLGI
jgi:hypothetical protein